MCNKLFIRILFLFLACSTLAIGQKDFSAILKKDLVSVENGKFSTSIYYLIKLANGNSFQVQMAANCPVDVMSRDKFVSFFSSYGMVLLMSTIEESGEDTEDIKELDELIGDPDLTYNFVMAKNGLQIQVITSEGKNNLTMNWEEVLE